jgi:hypothetical protein
VSSTELILLTNVPKIFEEMETFCNLEESFLKEYMPSNEKQLRNIFAQKKFILSVINADTPLSDSYCNTLAVVLQETGFPALILISKKSIRKFMQRFPVTVDFLVKPVSRFEFNLRINRIIELFKIMKEMDMLRNLEKEIDIRGNIMELSRQELIAGSETIKALDIAMELSRQELLNQKEEIMAREQVLELSRQDEMDLLAMIRAFEETLKYAESQKVDYVKEIEALENLLLYVIQRKKERGR